MKRFVLTEEDKKDVMKNYFGEQVFSIKAMFFFIPTKINNRLLKFLVSVLECVLAIDSIAQTKSQSKCFI